jgi:hypothetical protein
MSNDEYQQQNTWNQFIVEGEGFLAQIEKGNYSYTYKALTIKDIEDFMNSLAKNINESKF